MQLQVLTLYLLIVVVAASYISQHSFSAFYQTQSIIHRHFDVIQKATLFGFTQTILTSPEKNGQNKDEITRRGRSQSQSTPKKTRPKGKPIYRTLTSELAVQINLECFDGSYMGVGLSSDEVLRYCIDDKDGGGCVCVTGGLVRCMAGITTEKQQFCKSQCYCEIRRYSKF
jgi:hypothetical protein